MIMPSGNPRLLSFKVSQTPLDRGFPGLKVEDFTVQTFIALLWRNAVNNYETGLYFIFIVIKEI